MGVAIEHLESGQRLDVRGDAAYPMASTFKLPVFVTLFQHVDEGKVRLDERVSLESGDIHLGSGRLDDFAVPGVSLSIANLAALMMRVSDNSAADGSSRESAPAKYERLRALGIEGISVDRTAERLILDSLGRSPRRTEGMSHREIAEIARYAFDYFQFSGLGSSSQQAEADTRPIRSVSATPLRTES